MKQFPSADCPEPTTEHSLVCHDLSPVHGVDGIGVTVKRLPDGRLWLRYHVDGPLEDLVLPDPADPTRTEGLWQTTCCELFLSRDGGPGYLEFNFAPSSKWAAYRFADYRAGAEDLPLAVAPEIALGASASHLALEVILDLPPEWQNSPLIAAVSAVIEEMDGTKSYWALQHPPGKPDFHHPDCFQLPLGAPDAA